MYVINVIRITYKFISRSPVFRILRLKTFVSSEYERFLGAGDYLPYLPFGGINTFISRLIA